MDKVIIDGVDVSECKFCMYKGFKAFPQCKLNIDSFATACVQHKDCHYKQLMRARAEIEIYKQSEIEGQEIVAELKAENEKLKSDFDKCMDANKYHFDKWCKCEQCLQEIKEMAELFNCTYENKDLDRFKNNILYKINEVIGAEK